MFSAGARYNPPNGAYLHSITVVSLMNYDRLAANKRIAGLTLAHLLSHYGRQSATDPLDHIFSLIGLV